MFNSFDYLLLILATIKKRKFYAFIGLIYFFIFCNQIKKTKIVGKKKNNMFRYIMD